MDPIIIQDHVGARQPVYSNHFSSITTKDIDTLVKAESSSNVTAFSPPSALAGVGPAMVWMLIPTPVLVWQQPAVSSSGLFSGLSQASFTNFQLDTHVGSLDNTFTSATLQKFPSGTDSRPLPHGTIDSTLAQQYPILDLSVPVPDHVLPTSSPAPEPVLLDTTNLHGISTSKLSPSQISFGQRDPFPTANEIQHTFLDDDRDVSTNQTNHNGTIKSNSNPGEIIITTSGNSGKAACRAGSGSSSMNIAKGLLPSPQSVPYAKSIDWERHKSTISMYYFGENMPVADLVVYISAQYNFHATDNMYKKQFKKWNWSKYKSKPAETQEDCSLRDQRSRDRTRITCRRGLRFRRSAINRNLTADGLLEVALRDYSVFVEEYFTQYLGSGTTDSPQQLQWSGMFTEHFETALIHLNANDTDTGLRFLRHGFRQAAQALEAFDFEVGTALLWSIPETIARYKHWVVLEQYLLYLTRISADHGPVMSISSALLEVLRQCPHRAVQFLSHAIDFYGKGSSDLHNIRIETEQVCCQVRHKIFTGDLGWTVNQLIQGFNSRIQEARMVGDHETALGLICEKMWLLLKANQTSVETLGSIQLAQEEVKDLADGATRPFSEWEYSFRLGYLSLQTLVLEHHIESYKTQSATAAAITLMSLAESGHPEGYDPGWDVLESLARYRGMDDLAGTMHDAWKAHESVCLILEDSEVSLESCELESLIA